MNTLSTPVNRPRRSCSTTLHAGGKFGGGGYKVSGGLHGVGVSIVNALSTELILEVDLNGNHYQMTFKNGGKPQGKLKITGPAPRGRTGTSITFTPDPSIFDDVEFRAQTITERLQIMAFLNRGLEIRYIDERAGRQSKETFKYNGGIVDYVRHLNNTKESLFRKVGFYEQSEPAQEVEVAFQWNTGLLREHPLLRERHRHHRGRHARRGISQGHHQRGQSLRPQTQPLEGEGREPRRRGHPRGPHGDRVGAPGRTPVRRSDQGQARQRLDSFVGGARDE